jgi:hypothetical protein
MTIVRKKKKAKVQIGPSQIRILKASIRQLFGSGLLDSARRPSDSTTYFLREALDSKLLNN